MTPAARAPSPFPVFSALPPKRLLRRRRLARRHGHAARKSNDLAAAATSGFGGPSHTITVPVDVLPLRLPGYPLDSRMGLAGKRAHDSLKLERLIALAILVNWQPSDDG